MFLGVLIPTAAGVVIIYCIVLSPASGVSLADPFRDCHCWLMVRVLLLLCCWISLMVFHIGIAFSSSSSIWNPSTSWVGISTTSTTMSIRSLSRPLPTPRPLSRPLQIHDVLPLSTLSAHPCCWKVELVDGIWCVVAVVGIRHGVVVAVVVIEN